MSDVSLFLLVVAAILVIGIVGEIVFARTGVPDVVWLILTGILLGPAFGLVSQRVLQTAAPYFGALTLVVVLFDGGAELKFKELSLAAGRGTTLALFGFVTSVVALTLVAWLGVAVGILPQGWGWLQCLLVGTILGGSSSVVIMPALRMAGLSSRISNIVNLESALTDVLSVVATGAVIAVATAKGVAASTASSAGTMFGRSFGIGIGVGLLFGFFAVIVLRRLRKSGYGYPLMLGTLMILYVLVDELGGSAALAILAAAVMIGNAPTLSKMIGLARTARLGSSLEGVHDEITFIIKSFFFTFLGAMLGPPWGLMAFGVFLGIVLWLARVPIVRLATIKSGLSAPARGLIGVLMPRGMAAGVLAMFPAQAGIPGTKDLPVLIFSTVFTTILLFAVGFPVFRKRLPASDLAGGETEPETAPEIAAETASAAATATGAAPASGTAPAAPPFAASASMTGPLASIVPGVETALDAADTLVGATAPDETTLTDAPAPADATAVAPPSYPSKPSDDEPSTNG